MFVGRRCVDAILVANGFALLRAILGGGKSQDVPGVLAAKGAAVRAQHKCFPNEASQ
eukprot:CAMPEP_0174326488 /NCGR_PEP_ID=MMETSP0810-20121108/13936_1 /TAXON_ID=73025 ORGANISM="Eutreptiella gymnastica-like, Strain CCMP1594" /NCGR_SAMPLE_ID=MMETSP0810 /ASSEMBLY_ACC=CAM_ASM_000659 /LENGTH=56 /DNA_ID=CAMNT_0015440123 /DNA_START=1 /DNA_END=171 /DNA_ORIENTATION=-